MRNYLRLSEKALERINATKQKYKQLYLEPENCEPLVVFNVPSSNKSTWEEMLSDPECMLKTGLDNISTHLEIGDDYLPMVRVNFGTAQIAAAFGVPIEMVPNSLPAAGEAVLKNAGDVYDIKMPSFNNGWIPKLEDFTQHYLKNVPDWVSIQHPDIQSAFNTGHLIRGNDILYDFYDVPETVRTLLKKVTDFMIDFTKYVKCPISTDEEWFYDAGGLWKGGARISNCTMQIISPELYKEFVMTEDNRFLKTIGGGRVHYCGSNKQVIDEFFKIKDMHALEIDCQYHDIVDISEKAPKDVTVMFCDWSTDLGNGPWLKKLLSGNIPNKKNIVISAKAANIEEAKKLYKEIKQVLN